MDVSRLVFGNRITYQPFFKVTRGIADTTKRPGDEFVVDKAPRNIFAVSGSNLVEICHAPIAGEIDWSDAIQLHVRSRVAEVLGE